MCSVSMVHDWAKQIQPDQWTRPMFDGYQELVRRLDELDKRTKQPECEDPSKADFMKRVLERLEAIEKKLEPPKDVIGYGYDVLSGQPSWYTGLYKIKDGG